MMVLGTVITVVGGTGIFAVFTDRATQGPNTADSGPRPKAADIQLSTATADTNSAVTCGTFQDDLTTALWEAHDLQPFADIQRYLCIKNVGAAAVDVYMGAIDLQQSDPECTGDEATVDADCGSGAGHGQLADALMIEIERIDCDGTFHLTLGNSLSALATGSMPVTATSLPSGEKLCVKAHAEYPFNAPEELIQRAQSDAVSWRLAFDATAQ